MSQPDYTALRQDYDHLSGGLIKMISEADTWCGPATVRESDAGYSAAGLADFERPR